MDKLDVEKIFDREGILDEMITTYTIQGWSIRCDQDVKYISETCTEGYVLDDEEQIRDLLQCRKKEKVYVEACNVNEHFAYDGRNEILTFLNSEDRYRKILKAKDPMKIIDRIEWKIDADTDRQFYYVHVNLDVPNFYYRTMDDIMNDYFEQLSKDCREINLKHDTFKPRDYQWDQF